MFKLNTVILSGIASLSLFAADVHDAAFSKVRNGELAAWRNTNKAKFSVQDGVLSIIAANGKFEDSIYQGQKIEPSERLYVFSADVDAPIARSAYVQIKMFGKNRELLRKSFVAARAGKSRLTVRASHPEADYIEYAMRIRRNGAGKEFKFSDPTLRTGDSSDLYGPWRLGGGGKGYEIKYLSDNSFVITVAEAKKLHAAVVVSRKVKAGEKFIFEADYSSDMSKMGYLEIKYYNKGKELKRKQCYSDAAQGKLSVEIDCGNCDMLDLQCRVPLVEKYVGKKVTFSNIKLKKVN